MVLLSAQFKSNTSPDWASERLTKLGLSERTGGISEDLQFMLVANLNGFCALVRIPDDREIEYSRTIYMISPQVVRVSRA